MNNITCLRATLTKQVKDLYEKNFNSLKKETKEHIRRWKILPCSWINKSNIVNDHLTKSNLQIQCNPHQNSNTILYRLCKQNSKLHIDKQKPRIAKIILNNKSISRCITIIYLKLYYRAIILITAWYCYRNKLMDQLNWMEDPEMTPQTYGNLIFWHRRQNYTRKKRHFQQVVLV